MNDSLCAPACHTEADARDVVIVEPRPLTGHPGEDPGVHPVVLVHELVTPMGGVVMNEWLPEVSTGGETTGNVLELDRREKPVMGDEAIE